MRVAILLAAGASRRFGPRDKLLARFRGAPLIARALRIAQGAPAVRVVVATDPRGPRLSLLRRIEGPRTRLVRVAHPELGLSESLKAAFAALRPVEREAYVFLADMPLVPPTLARRLGRAPARPGYRGTPGHPVLARKPDRAMLARLSGDAGLRAGGRMRLIPAGPGCVADIDDPHLLRRARLSHPRRS